MPTRYKRVSYSVQDEVPADLPVVLFVTDDTDGDPADPGELRMVYRRDATADEIAGAMNAIAEDWRRRNQPHPLLRIVHRTAAAAVAPLTGLSLWAAHFAAASGHAFPV